MSNFLIIRTSAIGDIVQTFPVVDYLKRRYPEAWIDWVVEESYAPLLKAHPDVDQVLAVQTQKWRRQLYLSSEVSDFRKNLREKRYDAVFDLQGNTKSALFTFMARGPKVGFGWQTVPEKANWFAASHHFDPPLNGPIQLRYLSVVQSYFHDSSPFVPAEVLLKLTPQEESQLETFRQGDLRILVAFGSKWENKRLSPATLKQFLDSIAEKYRPVFYFIGGTSRELAEAQELTERFAPQSVLIGKISLPLLQAVMREMSLVIAMDSAALHLCGTTKTPSFSIFGPSLATVYKPVGDQHIHIQGTCPYQRQFESRCPVLRSCPTGACIRDLPMKKFLSELSKILLSIQKS